MKYTLIILFCAYFVLSVFIADSNLLSILWFTAPVICALIIEVLYISNMNVSRKIPIIGLIVFFLSVPVYIHEYFYTGDDAQAGLASALIPPLQLAIFAFVIIMDSVRKRT